MSTVTVSTNAGLMSALKTAHGGDTILLAPGNYGTVFVYNYHPTGTINITSANAANPAVISALNINQSSGLHFSHLTFATSLYNAPTSTFAATPFVAYGSSNLSFDHISVHGTMDNNPQDDVNGMRLQGCSNVSITNSEFQQLYNAITDLSNTNVVISNNSFHDIRNDGIDNGGTSNVTISGNSFTNFYPVGAVGTTGDHADAIQFWTANTTADAQNIAITNNTVVRGAGSYIQGVFVTDQVGVHFDNVTITGNMLAGTEYNGIAVGNAQNLNISNNTVESYAGMLSQIVVRSSTGISLNHNVASGYALTNSAFLSQLGNQTIGAVNPLQTSPTFSATAMVSGSTAVSVVAEVALVAERLSASGSALTGDQGSSLYVADVGVGSAQQKQLASGGATLAGTYGALTIHPDGTYSYAATKEALTVGQTYDDHFTVTVASATGGAHSSTLDFIVTGSAVGNGLADTIVGGAGAETISGFGAKSFLVDGTGPDTFAFNSVSQSTTAANTRICGFKAGDTIDLSGLDPLMHVVTSLDGHAHEVMIRNDANGVWDIYGDVTGTGTSSATADFLIHVTGSTTTITASSIHI